MAFNVLMPLPNNCRRSNSFSLSAFSFFGVSYLDRPHHQLQDNYTVTMELSAAISKSSEGRQRITSSLNWSQGMSCSISSTFVSVSLSTLTPNT
ncbi:hypothetical protein DVH05_028633 [Phytophthora capsici]|nr:hypothetical protein DVH05_028633 [Phytophthora capsici]